MSNKFGKLAIQLVIIASALLGTQLANADTRKECPKGFTDAGATCTKPASYGRGTGFMSQKDCEEKNPQGCEKNMLLYYPKCKEGFHAVGCCVCSPDCPKDMKDIGVACEK